MGHLVRSHHPPIELLSWDSSLRLPLGLEAPFMTPNSIIFVFLSVREGKEREGLGDFQQHNALSAEVRTWIGLQRVSSTTSSVVTYHSVGWSQDHCYQQVLHSMAAAMVCVRLACRRPQHLAALHQAKHVVAKPQNSGRCKFCLSKF